MYNECAYINNKSVYSYYNNKKKTFIFKKRIHPRMF